jgi:UDP-4-amino-4-deoxy-L-arabinose-oxoglutarate aminotransferase
MLNMQVAFYKHGLTSNDANAMADVIATPFLTSGPVGKKVEAQLAQFFNISHALLTNSWTNGAIATLLALGIKAGDEVIVPAMTFIASANVVEILGATPILVDVDPDTQLMRVCDIEPALSEKTRAIIPVHLYGQMCDMKAIAELVKSRNGNIAIIEDCAHNFEGELKGEKPGKYSDAAIFSFYATKNVACGEGGAIITNNAELHQNLLQTRLHGMSAGAADRFKTGSYNHWDMTQLGVKANLPDLLAALLPNQIDNIYEQLAKRTILADRYRKAFINSNVKCIKQIDGTLDAHHLFPIGVDTNIRDEILTKLGENGIGATVNYRAIHTLTFYKEKYGFKPSDFPNANAWGESAISLPLYPSLTFAEQDYVIETVKRLTSKLQEKAAS